MKYIKKFNEINESINDNQTLSILQNIESTFDIDKLKRIDNAMYGYYFKYSDTPSVEVGLTSLRIDGDIIDVSRPVLRRFIDFFESKGKGEITPSVSSLPGW